MLAFLGVWIALASFVLAVVMLVYRPAFTDVTVVLVLWLGSPLALCFAFLTLWAFRKEAADDPGLAARRRQAKVAVALSLIAAAIVYGLIIASAKLEPIEGP